VARSDPRRWLSTCLAIALLVAGAGVGRAEEAPPPPTTAVIFGATGDLAKRKVFPSLLAAFKAGKLPSDLRIVAASRDDLPRDAFLARLREGMRTTVGLDVSSDPKWAELEQRIDYQPADLTSRSSVRAFGDYLDEVDRPSPGGDPRRRMYYLAVTPSILEPATKNLIGSGLLNPREGASPPLLLVEKPFGRDVASARRLNRILSERISPERVMRMDHYLGKPAMDDLRQLRASDRDFARIWNRHFVTKVEISATEKIGIEGRGGFYEETGALRDFAQGHLVQSLVVTAMEQGKGSQAKADLVRALRPLDPRRDAIRGQYQGYRAEPGVAPDSQVETYVALKAEVDNPRWRGVPFLLESGKQLAEKRSVIKIHFRRLSPELARRFGVPANRSAVLEVEIDPSPSITLQSGRRRVSVMERASKSRPDPYERLLVAAMRGEQDLFVGGREVERAWAWLEPVQKQWQRGRGSIATYPDRIRRPASAEALFSPPTLRTLARKKAASKRARTLSALGKRQRLRPNPVVRSHLKPRPVSARVRRAR
jgi:glucose-6-phosphate 1-dehydrogenase